MHTAKMGGQSEARVQASMHEDTSEEWCERRAGDDGRPFFSVRVVLLRYNGRHS